jgi:hypothetical protein
MLLQHVIWYLVEKILNEESERGWNWGCYIASYFVNLIVMLKIPNWTCQKAPPFLVSAKKCFYMAFWSTLKI